MKNIQTVISTVAEAFCVSPDEVSADLRALFAFLTEDPEFRAAWEEIPKPDGLSEEEALLAVMIADAADHS